MIRLLRTVACTDCSHGKTIPRHATGNDASVLKMTTTCSVPTPWRLLCSSRSSSHNHVGRRRGTRPRAISAGGRERQPSKTGRVGGRNGDDDVRPALPAKASLGAGWTQAGGPGWAKACSEQSITRRLDALMASRYTETSVGCRRRLDATCEQSDTSCRYFPATMATYSLRWSCDPPTNRIWSPRHAYIYSLMTVLLLTGLPYFHLVSSKWGCIHLCCQQAYTITSTVINETSS